MQVCNWSAIPDVSYLRVKPAIAGSTPRIPQNVSTPVKRTVPSPRTSCKENIRIEYRKGVIIINGKKINLPDTDKMLAQFSQGKKIFSTEKNQIDIHLND